MWTVYHAYNFLIDFPRTLNILLHPEDSAARDNREGFKTFMDRQQHSTIATTVSWERFIEVMEYLKTSELSESEGGLSWVELELRVSKE